MRADLLTTRPVFFRSGKLQSESSSNFSNFCPEFCPEFLSEFSPNFLKSFRASFCGKRKPEKIHQKSLPFFNAKFPGKHEKNIHKMFLERRQSNVSCSGTKKGHKHKEFGQKAPLPDPPQGTPDPPNPFCLGPLFPSKYRKKAYIKNFERGGLWGPKILYAEFLRVLFCT